MGRKRSHSDSESSDSPGPNSPSYKMIPIITVQDDTPMEMDAADEEIQIIKEIPGGVTTQVVEERRASSDDSQEPPELLTDRSRSSSRSGKRSRGISPSTSSSRSRSRSIQDSLLLYRSRSRSRSNSPSRSRSKSMSNSPSRSRSRTRSPTPACQFPEDCVYGCPECFYRGSRPNSRAARPGDAWAFSEEELPEIYHSDDDEEATEEDMPQMDDHQESQESQESWSSLPAPVPASDPKEKAQPLSPSSMETERKEKEISDKIERLMAEQREKQELVNRESELISLLNSRIKTLRISSCPGVSIVADLESDELILTIVSDSDN